MTIFAASVSRVLKCVAQVVNFPENHVHLVTALTCLFAPNGFVQCRENVLTVFIPIA